MKPVIIACRYVISGEVLMEFGDSRFSVRLGGSRPRRHVSNLANEQEIVAS